MDDRYISAIECLRLLEQRGLSGQGRFDPEDLAYLQVALMVAALDGRIEPREYDMFERMAISPLSSGGVWLRYTVGCGRCLSSANCGIWRGPAIICCAVRTAICGTSRRRVPMSSCH